MVSYCKVCITESVFFHIAVAYFTFRASWEALNSATFPLLNLSQSLGKSLYDLLTNYLDNEYIR